MLRLINKSLSPLKRKLAQVVSRGVVRLVNDSLKMQEMQVTVMQDETLDDVERMQNYGFTSHPHAGAEAITVSVNGQRSHSVAVVVGDKRYRLMGLAAGEVAMSDDLGNKIILGRNAVTIEAVTALNITAPTTTITSDVTVNGALVATGDVTMQSDLEVIGEMKANNVTYSTHRHNGDSGGTTGIPY